MKILNLSLLSIFTFGSLFTIYANNVEFVVLIPSYNNQRYCLKNLDSVVKQKCNSPFKVIYINDCSTDNTLNLVTNYVKKNKLESLVTIINNENRVGALANCYNIINTIADNKVVAIVDGDDYLAHDKVLARVEQEYFKKDIWLTYGQYQYYPDMVLGICRPIPKGIMDNNYFRYYQWVTSHLRTFKAKLFKKIKQEDLLYQGSYFSMCYDIAIMLPMLEMASKDHISFIPEVLYYYNYQNPICDHNTNRILQYKINLYLCLLEPYKALDSL